MTIGVLTRIAAALLIMDMIGAIILVKTANGFVGGMNLSCYYRNIFESAVNWPWSCIN
jgi:uncharacterized membrane protein YphA (DoxX/SURF4 family)